MFQDIHCENGYCAEMTNPHLAVVSLNFCQKWTYPAWKLGWTWVEGRVAHQTIAGD